MWMSTQLVAVMHEGCIAKHSANGLCELLRFSSQLIWYFTPWLNLDWIHFCMSTIGKSVTHVRVHSHLKLVTYIRLFPLPYLKRLVVSSFGHTTNSFIAQATSMKHELCLSKSFFSVSIFLVQIDVFLIALMSFEIIVINFVFFYVFQLWWFI